MNVRCEPAAFSPALLAEAAEWLIRLQAEGASEVDTSAWLEWCNKDPRNLEAFDRVQGLKEALRSLPASDRDMFLQLANSPSMVSTSRSFLHKATIGTALAAGLTAVAFLITHSMNSDHTRGQKFATSRGGQREVRLIDDSRVTLGAASSVITRYSESARHIVLEGGEAYFQVQPNHARPFVVVAGPVTVTAVGTKFDVRRTRQRIVVTITEGAVDVAPEGATVPVRVQAGQRATEETDTHRLTIASIDPSASLAWRRGRLEFVGEPLGSVIEDINRYAARPITIDDTLRNLIFTGTVFGDRADEWARALGSVFPVRAITRSDGSILLTPKSGIEAGP